MTTPDAHRTALQNIADGFTLAAEGYREIHEASHQLRRRAYLEGPVSHSFQRQSAVDGFASADHFDRDCQSLLAALGLAALVDVLHVDLRLDGDAFVERWVENLARVTALVDTAGRGGEAA